MSILKIRGGFFVTGHGIGLSTNDVVAIGRGFALLAKFKDDLGQ